MIDPGPDVPAHVRALTSAVADAGRVRIVLTHGHADHAAAARPLADEVGADVYGPEGVEVVDRVIGDGDVIDTDAGGLVAVSTPGHTREHLCFHWPERRALFAGDVMLGEGDTTWVGEYAGCVADYLASLARLSALDLDVIYPAHGPPIDDPPARIECYRAHREARIEQVRAALDRHPGADADALVRTVYGSTLPAGAKRAATSSIAALIVHVRAGASA